MATLTPEQLAAVNKYRDAKKARRRRNVATGVTGLGMNLSGVTEGRGGGGRGSEYYDSRQGYIEGGVDEHDAWMTQKEKLENTAKLNEALADDEQFYAGKQLEKYLQELDDDRMRWDTAVKAEMDKFAQHSRNSSDATRYRMVALQNKQDTFDAQVARDMVLSEEGVAEAEAAGAEIRNIALASAGTPEVLVDEWGTGTTEMDRSAQQLALNQALGAAATGNHPKLGSALTNTVDNIAQKYMGDPNQATHMLQVLSATAAAAGINLDTLVQAGSGEAQTAITQALSRSKDYKRAADRRSLEMAEKRADEARRVGGPTEALDALIADRRQVLAEREAQPTSEVTTRDFSGEGEEAPAGGEPAFDPMSQETTLGLPIRPASDAETRTLQLLDIVNEYPEHPPAQEARRQLVASPAYTQYTSSRGYEGLNENDVLKEMAREARVQTRENTREFRKRKRGNIERGVSADRVPARVRVEPRSKPPVTGDGE
jgi:hypothetical protein